MAIFEDRLDSFFSDEAVQTWELFFKTIMETDLPKVDVKKGSVIYDLLIRPAAVFNGLTLFNINRMRRSMSLREIILEPSIADDFSVNDLLSNFGIARKGGTKATGSVTIFLSNNNTTSIPAGATFSTGTLTFVTQSSFVGVPSNDLVSKETDRLIRSADNGTFAFDIEVIASEEGDEFQLASDTTLTLLAAPANYITSQTLSDFSSGKATETNEELLVRLASGVSGKTTASKKHIRSFIEEQFEKVTHGSVVGFGDAEMTRDRNNIFGIGYGGKSDIYVQTDSRPTVEKLTKTAFLLDASKSLWQISLDRDEFAGVMKVDKVLPNASNASGSLLITSDVRNINTAPFSSDPDTFIPDIQSYTQGSFSRYQTSVISFIDSSATAFDLTEGTATRDFDVYLVKLPDIAAIQDTILNDSLVMSHRYDDLIRTPIPCFVSVALTIKAPINTEVDTEAIKTGIAKRINDLGFTSSLSSSIIVDAVHDFISSSAQVAMPVSILGELISPEDGSPIIMRSNTVLKVADDFSKSISRKTVMFFSTGGDSIDISVEAI